MSTGAVPFPASPLPDDVALVAITADAIDERALAQLGRGEIALAAEMRHPLRQQERQGGRIAARQALARLGLEGAGEVLVGRGREPLWPAGAVGSISHKEGVAIAAVARAADYLAIGIDLETLDRPVAAGVIAQICRPDERAWVEAAGDADRIALRLRQVFAAKESLYKALWPLGRIYFGYQEAELTPRAGGLTAGLTVGFAARLLADVAPGFATGATVEIEVTTAIPWMIAGVAIRRTRS